MSRPQPCHRPPYSVPYPCMDVVLATTNAQTVAAPLYPTWLPLRWLFFRASRLQCKWAIFARVLFWSVPCCPLFSQQSVVALYLATSISHNNLTKPSNHGPQRDPKRMRKKQLCIGRNVLPAATSALQRPCGQRVTLVAAARWKEGRIIIKLNLLQCPPH